MAKKRKVGVSNSAKATSRTKYDLEEHFDDSEDEFYTGRDKVLLDNEPATKRRKKQEEQERDLQPSDEEVLGYDSDIDADEEDEQWGTSKSDYYNADVIETEADALEEEAEARRLQQKQIKSMTEADFGFDETTWVEEKTTQKGPIVERLPDIQVHAGATKDERLNILKNRYPEFEPLARDFIELHAIRRQLSGVKLRALSAYLGAVAMYFAVITSTARQSDEGTITALPPNELRNHAIVDQLIITKKMWEAAKDVEEVVEVQESVFTKPEIVRVEKPKIMQPVVEIKTKKIRKEKPELDGKSKTKSKNKLVDLQSLLAQSATPHEEESDFGDEALTEEQLAEKAKRKKSLRFYTSQIAQKANKRGAASRDAGGDDDVPHKERMRDKQDRLMREAEKRGQQKPDVIGQDDEDDEAVEQNDYYNSLVERNNEKKANKQARADAYAEAARQGGQVYEEEQVVDGKRAITYAIEKNKGLMPKRKKDVRNPRVKKRKKYDEKKKKLSSMRQVYKGGEGRGGYGGELTGIKTNVVKSVKL